jgi:hypothetical protein
MATVIPPQGMQVDVAVISHNYAPMNLNNSTDHVVELDPIIISEELFKSIFYTLPSFGIPPLTATNPTLLPYISLTSQHRTILGEPFYLLETIYGHLEQDLHLSRLSFAAGSKIALNKNITKMTSLCSLRISNVVSSLSWSELLETIVSQYDVEGMTSAPIILTVSIILSSPTPNVYPTILHLNYATTVTLPA